MEGQHISSVTIQQIVKRQEGLSMSACVHEQQTARLKKKRIEPEVPLLTQEELLAEAAQTEIENIKSLQVGTVVALQLIP